MLFVLVNHTIAFSQGLSRGRVLNTNGKPVINANIRLSDDVQIGKTDSLGYFISTEKLFPGDIVFAYQKGEKISGHRWEGAQGFDLLWVGEGLELIGEVRIGISQGDPFLEELKPKKIQLNPSIGGGIESLVKTFIGASTGNELSSQYSVRGGNYDENLIYVNDIEILRPQLISSGQQEGLSFINADLVQSIKYSAGGFGAQYGDKMSSVLDVSYFQPDSFRGACSLGTMLNSAMVSGKKNNLSGFVGIRNFNNSLLTQSLNVQGNYSMRFTDIQSLITYSLTRRISLDFLGNFAHNNYTLNPTNRTTTFGTVQNAYQLDVGMDGQESLKYRYVLGSFTVRFKPSVANEFKWMINHTSIEEQEVFDVEGAYYLNQLDRDLGSKTYGKPLKTLGYGYYIDHGRNKMGSGITQVAHLGKLGKPTDKFSWQYGIRVNRETIHDKILEWLYNDSAEYNIAPFGKMEDSILFDNYTYANNTISSWRGKAYLSFLVLLNKSEQLWLSSGIRANYSSLNQEFIAMPRMSIGWEPHKNFNVRQRIDSLKKPDLLFKFALGAYHQPSFYREMRNFEGRVNQNLLSQKSWHALLGFERFFFSGSRKFKYTAEAYYKQYDALVPYLFDNIRIRYYGNNSAKGYAWGIDQRIYGEFTKGLESWFTLGIMQSKEQIDYVSVKTGSLTTSTYLRRPTDRRLNLGAVFQDQMPNNPSLRVNLSLNIGTGIPYYLDGDARYTNTPNVIPPYRRVDIGFSKLFDAKKNTWIDKLGLAHAWLSLDIFNILAINNVIGYSWVKDLQNNRYGVPDYLTGRRINLRLFASF